jgi:hypothetical protein
LRCTTEKLISIWLSQEAWIGRWTRRRLGHWLSRRFTDARPRVGAAVVDHPVPPLGRGVGLASHDLGDQPAERGDAGRRLAAAEQRGLVHVPRRQIRQRPAALVLVLDPHRARHPWGQARVAAAAGLDARLLVGAEDMLVVAERPAGEPPLVEVEDDACLGGEVGSRTRLGNIPPGATRGYRSTPAGLRTRPGLQGQHCGPPDGRPGTNS